MIATIAMNSNWIISQRVFTNAGKALHQTRNHSHWYYSVSTVCFYMYLNRLNKLTMFSSSWKGFFDVYSPERNRAAEIVSKQKPMVVCSKVLKASDSEESLATTEILANSYSCEWFSLNGPIDVFNFIANGV